MLLSPAKTTVFLCAALAVSCGPLTELRERVEPDVTPPAFVGLRLLDESRLELCFDEPLGGPAEALRIEPALEVVAADVEECLLLLEVNGQQPGLRYHLEATVSDARGNSLSFMAGFYGFNPRVPPLLINEFTTRGSGNHPDVVELKALGAGDMAGVVLYGGTPRGHDGLLIFPSLAVEAGDFLLVHFKPQGIPEELDEVGDRTLSGGLDASPSAYDFWVPQGTGLSGNNGVIGLYARPEGGEILDGVLYSDRTSLSDSEYGGFGTRECLERALELVADGGWRTGTEQARPEDAVSPEGTTGTRSLCRDREGSDTDSAADWHIVPTLGFTFGAENSEEIYEP
jgi:hypothetical protein